MSFSGIRPAVLVLAVLAALPAFAQDHWIRLKTAHFEMYTDADEKKAIDGILHFERVREFFMQVSPVRAPGEFPVRVVAFKDPQVMHVYAPNPGVAAYYAPGPVRDTIVMKDPVPDSYPVSIHEYMHLVIRHSGLRVPLWLNEGWSDVFSTLKPVKDGVAVGDLIPRYMTILGFAKWFTLPELDAINNHSPEYNETARTSMYYAESWVLTHMLYLSPEYKEYFARFIGAMNRGMPLEQALLLAYNKTPNEVLADMQGYLLKKKLYGTVFLTPFEKSGETPVVTPLTGYETEVMKADLHAAALHLGPATRAYQQLETDEPTQPGAFEGAGYLALQGGDKVKARKEFTRAFALGTNDPQMCLQLAALDHEAKQPASVVMDELERAVKLRPDFPEAVFQLALMKVDLRDFEQALTLLGRVGTVPPERMGVFRSALAYCNLQRGNLTTARSDAEAAMRAAKMPAEKQSADRLIQLIEARSKGPAAALSGETVVRKAGTAVGLRCAAPGSGALSKMGINVDGRQLLLDLPDEAAVEIQRQPSSAKIELKCGALPPFPLVVEYAPASVANIQSAGIIRRLEF